MKENLACHLVLFELNLFINMKSSPVLKSTKILKSVFFSFVMDYVVLILSFRFTMCSLFMTILKLMLLSSSTDHDRTRKYK